MPSFVHTLNIKPKEGRLADARAVIADMAKTAENNGAKVRLMIPTSGDTSEAMMVLEFDSGEAWATFIQSDFVREARSARFDQDFPMVVSDTTVWQELEIIG